MLRSLLKRSAARKRNGKAEREVCCIFKDTLEFILAVSESSHPREFVGLLTAERTAEGEEVISDVIILPGTRSSSFSASFRRDMLPLGVRFVGTAHSHPKPQAMRPSPQDLQMFAQTGQRHIITFFPYGEDCWRCYDALGREKQLKVVERK